VNSTSVKIKICGLTRLEDAVLARDLGAWALGFIFYPKSPRFISPKEAQKSFEKIDKKSALKIGVFVDAPIDEIMRTVRDVDLDGVQLHGTESPSLCEDLKNKNSQLRIFKVFRPKDIRELEEIKFYKAVDAILIDTFSNDFFGGTGKISRWDLAQEAKALFPVILSGGLNSGNVLNALKVVNPYAFDISSGVEDSPGIKSLSKLKLLFKQFGLPGEKP
jgi:phosphoribosylanthranilate isomerase